MGRSQIEVGIDFHPTRMLPHCDLFIGHAGLNSVKESISYGVPMLLLPFFGDQHFIARRCQELGLGTILDIDTSIDAVASQIRAGLDSDRLRSSVQAMRTAMMKLPGRIY